MSNLTVVPDDAAIQNVETAARTPAEAEATVKIKAFVDRYASARNPGVVLQFLDKFMQNTIADKIQADAQSCFKDLNLPSLVTMHGAVMVEQYELAQENMRKKEEAEAKEEAARAEAKAAREAAEAEAKAAKEKEKADKIAARRNKAGKK